MKYEKIMKQLKSFNFTDAQRKKLASIILKLDKEKQDILVSGDNIATINGQSLLNGGNISLIKTGIFSIVTELPTNGIDKDKVYLVPSTETDNENRFSEYIYTDNGWEKLGTFTAEIDLFNYVQHTDVVTSTTNGLMLASDKTKLDAFEEAEQYERAIELPETVIGRPRSEESIKIVHSANLVELDYVQCILSMPGVFHRYARINSATSTKAGVMSSSDKVKLDGIKAGAQVNKIESVSVNGTPLEITNKGVNIPIHEYTAGDGINVENGVISTTPISIKIEKFSFVNSGSHQPTYNYSGVAIYDDRYISGTKYGIAFDKLDIQLRTVATSPDGVSTVCFALNGDVRRKIDNAITSISINNIGQVNTNGAVNLTIPNASITENGLMSKEDKAKLDSQPTIKASNATGVTDNDYVVIKKSELDSILSRLSALENKA